VFIPNESVINPKALAGDAGVVPGSSVAVVVWGVPGGGTARCQDKVGEMNSEQLQSLAVLGLAMVPVAVLWWVWIRMLD
jgi:hypothetical protein